MHNLGPSTDEHVMLLQDDFYKCMDLDAGNLETSLELSKEFQVIPENIRLKQALFDVYFSFCWMKMDGYLLVEILVQRISIQDIFRNTRLFILSQWEKRLFHMN